MKFALVNGERVEATKSAKGFCPACESELIARFCVNKVDHWAHKGNRNCDPWWENETEWHRAWKGQFPTEWQEVVHEADSGERHIADVKTDQGWVIEFQHSFLKREERRARDTFYPQLVWVVDGTRRNRDKSQFENALNGGASINAKPKILSVFTDECALLREWAGCRAPVFFDFAELNKTEGVPLWCLLPISSDGKVFVLPFSRAYFIKLHRTGAKQEGLDFAAILKDLNEIVSRYISHISAQHRRSKVLNKFAQQRQYRRSRQPESFQQYLKRTRTGRRF
ncbi:MAG: hypothetical protein KQI78_12280 [Deltaproteobacteria bacterium]|nr:hypothetical protein [Deltaproteobacteria bacterium]